eukprot:COSAG01_NODE_429_length_17183_cov_22.990869_23_plen_91_part_00
MIDAETACEKKKERIRKTSKLIGSIIAELQAINETRPIRIMGLRADYKLLVTVGTALGAVVGMVSRQLANKTRMEQTADLIDAAISNHTG